MTEVELQNVSKVFSGKRTAVAGLDWKLPAGALTVLVGASGSGKTTTLRLIAGLERPDHGRVLFAGEDQTPLPPHQRGVALVPQTPGLFPQWTVRQNMLGPTASEAQRLEEVAQSLEIESLLDRYPGEISGGEQQRVSLGRALMRRPRILLLDEPFGQLDGWIRHAVRRQLKQQQVAAAVTTLLVTHDPAEALAMADVLGVMNAGELLQSGSPQEVYSRPANLRVAQLLGRGGLNLWLGELVEKSGAWIFVTGGWQLPLPADRIPRAAAGQQLWLGIRAADVLPAGDGWELARGVIAAGGEYQGDCWLVPVKIADGQATIRMSLADNDWNTGQEVRLTVRPQALHWFAAPAGERLENNSKL